MTERAKSPLTLSGPIRCAIYARVSTDEQADRNLSIPAQIRECSAYALREGYIVTATYEDAGYSGTLEDRPQLQAMIQAAQRGEFDTLIVHKMDRLSRDEYYQLACKVQLTKSGIRIRSVTEPFVGGEHPAEKMMEGMMRVASAFYINNLRVEIKKGLDEIATRGRMAGPCSYGYDYADKHVRGAGWKVHEDEALWVRFVFRCVLEGKGLSDIARALNALAVPPYSRNRERGRIAKRAPAAQWSRNTVRWILRNRVYTGMIRHGEDWLPGAHEAIIEVEIFEQVQSILEYRPGRRAGASQDGLFVGGILRCAACGSHMIHTTSYKAGRRYSSYACSARHNWRARKNVNPGAEEQPCSGSNIGQAKVLSLLTWALEEFGSIDVERCVSSMIIRAIDTAGERASLETQVAFLSRLESGYIDMRATGELSPEMYAEKVRDLRAARGAARERLAELSGPREPAPVPHETISELLEILRSDAAIPVKRDMLRRVIEYITPSVDRKSIHVVFRPRA